VKAGPRASYEQVALELNLTGEANQEPTQLLMDIRGKKIVVGTLRPDTKSYFKFSFFLAPGNWQTFYVQGSSRFGY
jgi:hypothetical protein